MYQDIAAWYEVNMLILQEIYGWVEYDTGGCFAWIRINNYPLPGILTVSSSEFLIKTPGLDISNYGGFQFYLNGGFSIQRRDGKPMDHLFDSHSYNDLQSRGYSKLSFHLNGFDPRIDVVSGDNLFTICESVYYFLASDES